jgi:hypothetical protein
MLRGTRARCALIFLAALAALSVPAFAQKHASRAEKEKAASLPAVMWRDPGDLSKLNLFYGAGGRRDAPAPGEHFTFVREDMHGTSPKFDVVDAEGRKWRVKLAQESRPETAATRLLWAAGYFVDEDYFVPALKVDNLPKLRRGEKFVSADGTVLGARLELRRKNVRKLGNWSWFDNPFRGTRQLNGLRVMMCLMNNWDLKDENNSVYQVDGERRFLVTDLGASFGKTGNYFTRSKGDVKDYTRAKFVRDDDGDRIDLVMRSRPFFALKLYQPSKYRERARMEEIGKDIPVADARWIGHLLSGLSAAQVRDCFRAAGYDRATAEEYAETVERRISELNRLSRSQAKQSWSPAAATVSGTAQEWSVEREADR